MSSLPRAAAGCREQEFANQMLQRTLRHALPAAWGGRRVRSRGRGGAVSHP